MFTFVVTPDGGAPYEIKASTRDVLMWEETGRDRSMAGLLSDMHLADIYRIAHIAARRQGLFDGNAQQFKDTCDINVKKVLEDATDEEYAGPDPTQPEASAEE